MDRVAIKDYEWLKTRRKTAYEILEIQASASQDSIRKAYRKKALSVHPDKNKQENAEESFREVVVSYNVLSDLALKKEYDTYLLAETRLSNSEDVPSRNLYKNATAQRFRTELKNKENKHISKINSEIQKKRKVEELTKWYDDYVKNSSRIPVSTGDSIKKQQSNSTKNSIFPTLTLVKWKNRKEAALDDALIKKLMEVFGTVLSTSIVKNDSESNYHYAQITFRSPAAAALAATHDFSMTADYWDSLNLRKISSLLRDVELVNYESFARSGLAEGELPSLDYIAFSIMKRQP